MKVYSFDIVCQEVPNEISLAVNISGCPNRCPGCHSPWLWEDEGEEMNEELLRSLIDRYSAAITCFCFMGGDANPKEIERMALWVKENYPHLKTAWYSGREEIPEGFKLISMDFIKVGPYIEELGGLKSHTTKQIMYSVHTDGGMEKCKLY